MGSSSQMEKLKKRGSVGECVDELCRGVNMLARHLFTADWLREQIKKLKANLPVETGLLMMPTDFCGLTSDSAVHL
ncbi:hypothetical protein BaRGS_00028493 [Batillaria attramentaria]|uniref:Uncharacterized protein n=1 Tax=Batillaria attramentaria TaxID=370345 RepID=A0ABD0JYS3_9CAEN